MERVSDDKRTMFVRDLCDLSNFLSTAVSPGDVVNGDDRGVVVDCFLPLFEWDGAVIVAVEQADVLGSSVFFLEVPQVDVGWKVEFADNDVAFWFVVDAAGQADERAGDVWDGRYLVEGDSTDHLSKLPA